MGLAEEIRLGVLGILQSSLNEARAVVREQLVSGQVNPVVNQARAPAVQGGFTPTKVDVHMDKYIENKVRATWPDAYYASEELERNTDLGEGQLIFSCDPVDGTTNAFTILGKWAIVLYADMYMTDRLVHLGGGIAMSDGEVITWQNFGGRGEVWVDFPGDYAWPGLRSEVAAAALPRRPSYTVQLGDGIRRGPYPGKTRRFASVAHSVKRRRLLADAFDLLHEPPDTPKDGQVWLSSIGGNSIASGLLLGELGASVEINAVKLIDAAYLIPLVLAGGVVVDLDDNELDVWEAFSRPASGRIGPFIAAASEDAVKELVWRRLK